MGHRQVQRQTDRQTSRQRRGTDRFRDRQTERDKKRGTDRYRNRQSRQAYYPNRTVLEMITAIGRFTDGGTGYPVISSGLVRATCRITCCAVGSYFVLFTFQESPPPFRLATPSRF